MNKLVTLFLLLSSIFAGAQQNLQNLRFDNDRYFYFREPGANNAVIADVSVLILSLQLISTDNSGIERLSMNQRFRNPPGRPFYLLAIPQLYEVDTENDINVYKFGQNGGEDNFNSAEVRILRNSTPSSPVNVGRYIRPPVKFSVDADLLYTDPSEAPYDNQEFLHVTASEIRTATIEIDRQPNRGNSYVCIFSEKGDLLAALDPKDPDNNAPIQSFTTNKNVYVIPIVGKKVSKEGNTDQVTFEVGDPRENAVIRIFEE